MAGGGKAPPEPAGEDAQFVEMLDWEIIMIPTGADHVRPHPGPLPQERGNRPPTHYKTTIPVAR